MREIPLQIAVILGSQGKALLYHGRSVKEQFMIVCPNCNHQNPDGAVQCEACYTPLPSLASCPSCGAAVQSDASFCGQCGFDLRSPVTAPVEVTANDGPSISPAAPEIPPLSQPDPLVAPDPIAGVPEPVPTPGGQPASPPAASPPVSPSPSAIPDDVVALQVAPELAAPVAANPAPDFDEEEEASAPPLPDVSVTQIQVNQAKLVHIQSNNAIELPPQLSLIRIGKPNDRVPPDIDVSGFPNSEIVSRVHAQLRVEGDVYYIEDVGSSNGTYVNNMPLPYGNRHRLRPGDRIALGKGDKVSFIFQFS